MMPRLLLASLLLLGSLSYANAAVTAPVAPTLTVTAYPNVFDASMAKVTLSWYGSYTASGYEIGVAPAQSPANLWFMDVGYRTSYEADLYYGTSVYLTVVAYVRDASGNAVSSPYSNIILLTLNSAYNITVTDLGSIPTTDTTTQTGIEGTWLISETINLSQLGGSSETMQGTVTFSTSGSTLTATLPATGLTATGSISGSSTSGTITGTQNMDNGVTVTLTASFQVNGNTISGSGTYTVKMMGFTLGTVPTSYTGTRK